MTPADRPLQWIALDSQAAMDAEGAPDVPAVTNLTGTVAGGAGVCLAGVWFHRVWWLSASQRTRVHRGACPPPHSVPKQR